MNGFSQDLEATKKTTRLFRKVNGDNFINEGELCFSTENSVELIGAGDFCIVLESSEYTGMWADGDADAGKNFGYDEFRVEFSQEELLEKIEYIVVPNEWMDSDLDFEATDYIESEDPAVWIDNLENYGNVIAERDYETEIRFNF